MTKILALYHIPPSGTVVLNPGVSFRRDTKTNINNFNNVTFFFQINILFIFRFNFVKLYVSSSSTCFHVTFHIRLFVVQRIMVKHNMWVLSTFSASIKKRMQFSYHYVSHGRTRLGCRFRRRVRTTIYFARTLNSYPRNRVIDYYHTKRLVGLIVKRKRTTATSEFN